MRLRTPSFPMFLGWVLLAGSLAPFVAPAAAQARYPKTVLTVATHSSPGGGSDVFLREMAPFLSRIMGVTVVVDNVQGGSGARAMATLARARPDAGLLY